MDADSNLDSTPAVNLAEVLDSIVVSTEKRNAAMEAAEAVVGNTGVTGLSDILGFLNGPLAATLRLRRQPGQEWKFEPGWLLALELWDAIGRRQGDMKVVKSMVDWASAIGLGGEEGELKQVHHLANRFAWATRGTGGVPDQTLDATNIGDLLVLYVFAERRRFMFKFADLGELLRPHNLAGDPTLEASLALSEIMCGDQASAVERLEQALETARVEKRALQHPTKDIALHAMWLADGLDGQADRILEWADAFTTEPSPIVSFRRAKAFRLKGDFKKAMQEIQDVFDRIDGNTEFSRTFSEQAIREREIIQAVQLFHQSQAEVEKSVTQVKSEAVEEVKKVYDDSEQRIMDLDRNSLIRTVEVVTLFTAAVSFAIGGISLASGEGLTGQDRLRLLVGLGIGLLTFAFFIFAAFEFARTSQFAQRRKSSDSRADSSDSRADMSRTEEVFRHLLPIALVFVALVVVNVLSFLWLS